MITVIRATASWCQPCKALAPLLKKVEEQYAGRVNFKVVDVEEDKDTAEKYVIRSVPTVLFLDSQGESSGRLVGVKPLQDYIDAIEVRLKADV